MKKYSCLILISLWFTQLNAQRASVFVSKKNFQFSSDFYKPLAGWQAQTDSLGLTQENLQLASTAKLSEQWGNYLLVSKKISSIHQIQTDTKRGPVFFQQYRGADSNISGLQNLLSGTQYLVCIDSVLLESKHVPNVYVVSNRILSETKTIRTATIHLSLWDLNAGKLLLSKPFYWQSNENNLPQTPIIIRSDMFLMDKMWAELFNQFFVEWQTQH